MDETRCEVRYSVGEEIANSVTHGLGALLSLAGLIVLLVVARNSGDAWHLATCSIFGVTLILSYLTSTLYHSLPGPRTKELLRRLDHSAIFLLIAGTYTPFMLVNLRGPWGWSLFGAVWGIAVAGVLLKTLAFRHFRRLSVALYLLMGWIVVIAIKPLVASLDAGGWQLLLYGGLAYTTGVIFYGWKTLPYNHAVWHLFVLAGSSLHFFAVLFYVIPA